MVSGRLARAIGSGGSVLTYGTSTGVGLRLMATSEMMQVSEFGGAKTTGTPLLIAVCYCDNTRPTVRQQQNKMNHYPACTPTKIKRDAFANARESTSVSNIQPAA